MYGENKNLYITYNSVRNININNDTPKKEKKIQVILYITILYRISTKRQKQKIILYMKIDKTLAL